MAVTSTHADYDLASPKWRRMRDVIAGQDAVHAAGTAYLPRLSEQSDVDYAAYRKRATWFGATSRTVDALHGLLFRKAPLVEAPGGMAAMLDDLTMTGQSAEGFAQHLAREVLEVGRAGVLVDFPPTNVAGLTIGAAEAAGVRPFARTYRAESIINWRTERVRNRMMVTLVVLAETHETPDEDGFAVTVTPQYRVLRLVEGVYVQELYRDAGGGLEMIEQITPQRAGAPLPFVPFVFVGPEHVGPEMSDPPLIDMADLNLSHYRSTADLEHGAHYTGLPMLYVFGVHLEEGQKIALGSQTAITSPEPTAQAGYVEFSGQGLGALESLIKRKEAQMATLGASMLAEMKRTAEAAQTHEMRVAQETSALADIADVVSQAMKQVLEWMRDWARLTGDVSFTVNQDFIVTRMTAQDLAALLQLWQSGGISRATLYWNLQAGELVAPGKTVDDEVAEIEAEGPPLGSLGAISEAA